MQRTTDRETYRRLAETAAPEDRVPVELRVSVSDPFQAYRRARGDDWSVCLETTGGQSGWGYVAVDPVETLTVGADAVVRDRDHGGHGDYAAPSPTLAALEGFLETGTLVRGPCDVPYPGGTIGWLSYDVARELERLPDETTDERGLPRLQVARYDTVAAWEMPGDGESDDGTGETSGGEQSVETGEASGGETTLRIVASPPVGTDPDTGYDRALAAARDLAERVRDGDPTVGAPPADADAVTFDADVGRDAFAERVERVREFVRAGDTFQANVSHRLTAPAAVHPVEAYAALRAGNPAPYSGLVEFRGVDLASASPELLLRREPRGSDPRGGGDFGEGGPAGDDLLAEYPDATARLVTEPIAGTRPRGATTAADEQLEAELTGDEKERAEHAMLVDLERNDLGKVSVPGSVSVPEYRRVDRYAAVMHLVSLVTGAERPDRSLADDVAAVFPGGTITGAPKPRTMEIVETLETTRRGPYTGSLAIVGFDGRATLNILIRTLVRTGDSYGLRVGGGVVHDSVPDREYEETLDKARGLVAALDDHLDGASLAVAGRDESERSDPESSRRQDSDSPVAGHEHEETGGERP
ncbi:anthranilate synthase component I family protein [Halobaculum sp. MBLA0147]|uniref:anthranilate synthase component I family protein n=1 Tax=Halobaculum sp. MBLA0147 TaxID=3079934 RepID=UPI003524D3B6